MTITRKNYESYFIDLLDGTLSTEQVDTILDFLRENPDLADELKNLEHIKIDPVSHEKYTHKHLLKSDFDQADIFEEACIRSIENELSVNDEELLQHYIKMHPHAANEYRLFRATIAEPNPLIAYKNINQLKKSRSIYPFWYAIAASIVVGLFLWFSYKPQTLDVPPAQVIALNEKPRVSLENYNYHPQILKMFDQKNHQEITRNTQADVQIEVALVENETEAQLRQLKPFVAKVSTIQTLENKFALRTDDRKDDVKREQVIFPDAQELLALKIEELDTRSEATKLANFALNKLKDASNDKLDYGTNRQGKLNKIEFNSRLLAFSIPINNKEN